MARATGGRADQPAPCVEVTGVTKRYGATVALDDVSLEILPGTIHALVGENGAGKSTLLGVLAGRVAPTSGRVRIFGEPAALGNPRRARAAGVTAIYQELTIVPALDAAANVFLGTPLARSGWLARDRMRARFAELCRDFEVTIDPDVAAGGLSIADQQLLEIMRATQADSRVMLFDEPTASLGAPERAQLHALLRRLRSQGVTVVLVSHNLEEVLDLSDEITVFRDGRIADARPAVAWTKASLVEAMSGRRTALVTRTSRPPERTATDPVLTVTGLSAPGVLRDVTLDVAAGEIVGVAGLVGSGRTSLLRALAGLTPGAVGALTVDGRVTRLPRSVREAQRRGIALVPEDRKGQGLVLTASARVNIGLPDLHRSARAGWLSGRRLTDQAAEAARGFGFDPARLGQPVGQLSGGNQQKALLARWIYARPRVLLCDEPTRGIDIGAKEQILASLREFAGQGLAIVLASSEFEELVAACDRVVVLSRGRIVSVQRPGDGTVTPATLLRAAFDHQPFVEDSHVS